MAGISDKVADFFVRENVIEPAEYEIYKYGTEILIENIFMSLFLLVCGFIFDKEAVTVTFIIIFAGTRRCAGGYHADTKCKCHLFTIGNWMAVILLGMVQQRLLFVKFGAAFICCLIIFVIMFLFAPVENKRKKLLEKVKIQNRKKTLFFTIVIISFVLLFWVKMPEVSFAALVTLIEVALLILIGKEEKE